MSYPKVLYQFPQCAGQSFRPSNGTEGMIFIDAFCSGCIHENPDPDEKPKCEIMTATFLYDQNDKEYPKEWRYDSEGWPTCSKWQKWDWGNDGDPNDPDNPKRPPDPPDPRQLNLFPLHPTELELLPTPNEQSIQDRQSDSHHRVHSQRQKENS